MNTFLTSTGYSSWVLHVLLWLPLVAMFVVLFTNEATAKRVAFGAAMLEFVLSIPLWGLFNDASAAMQFASATPWIPQWGIYYRLGVDGISVLLVLLTTLLFPITILGSFKYIAKREKAFYAMMLLLETGVLGVFMASDLFLFFMFWEIMLVPMYFIIGIWGG